MKVASENDEIRWIALGDSDVPYSVRISSRARRVRLEIGKDKGLLVVVPRGFSLAGVTSVLSRKAHWILRKLDYFQSLSTSARDRKPGDGTLVPYRGKSLALDICMRPGCRPMVKREDGHLRVMTPSSTSPVIRDALDRWYRREARQIVTRRAQSLAREFGVSYNRLYIRNQRTRWGSCSTRRNLSFNWRLIMMPPEVMDYVIIHELTHLEVLNHSRHFWQLVGARCSGYQTHKSWLRENGCELRF